MNNSILEIHGIKYILDEVLLRLRFSGENNDNYLTFSLFADSKDLTQAGLAINSMTISGITKVEEIENRVFELDDDTEDELNELNESVICEPGRVLELSHLKIAFGSLGSGVIDTKLEAMCFKLDKDTCELEEDNTPIVGRFVTKIRL